MQSSGNCIGQVSHSCQPCACCCEREQRKEKPERSCCISAVDAEAGETAASLRVNVLPLSIDSGFLRRVAEAVAARCRIAEAEAADAGRQPVSAAVGVPAARRPADSAGASGGATRGGGGGGDRCDAACRVSVRLAVDCGHVDMLLDGTKLATLTWQELQVSSVSRVSRARLPAAACDNPLGWQGLPPASRLARGSSAACPPSSRCFGLAEGSPQKQQGGSTTAAGSRFAAGSGGAACPCEACRGSSTRMSLRLTDWQLLDHLAESPAHRCAIGSNCAVSAAAHAAQPLSPQRGRPWGAGAATHRGHSGMQSVSSLQPEAVPAVQQQRPPEGNSLSITLVRHDALPPPQPSGLTRQQLRALGGSIGKPRQGAGSDMDSACEPLPSRQSSLQPAADGAACLVRTCHLEWESLCNSASTALEGDAAYVAACTALNQILLHFTAARCWTRLDACPLCGFCVLHLIRT